MKPPIAKKIKEEITIHNDTRVDDYFWMRLSDEQKEAKKPDGRTQEVLDYLNAENAYLQSEMKTTENLQDTLYEEIVGRIKQDDQSVPLSVNGYTYYQRFEKGKDYPLFCRKQNVEGSAEEIMLNGPEMAENQSYFSVGSRSVSENNQFLAYSVDLVSRREYTIHIKDLKTGEILKDEIEKTSGSIVWANDHQHIFYTKTDPETLRSNQIFRHKIGTKSSEDVLVFEEKDETYRCGVSKSKSGKFIFIGTFQTLSTEYRFLDADNPNGDWQILHPREKDMRYTVSHFKDHFYLLTNYEAKNYRLMKTAVNKTQKENWQEVIAHRSDVLIDGIDIFKDYFVLSERNAGLIQFRVIKWSDKSEYYIDFNDPTYAAYTNSNPEMDSGKLRFSYTSLTTPPIVYDYNLETKEQEVMKQLQVLGGDFSSEDFISERVFVPSRDGAKIPMSIVYKKGFVRNGKSPFLLYGYGSYGHNVDPGFSSARLSLLNRGFVFAIAHIRGSQIMGKEWYEDGKLLKKKNTFFDFIDCGKYLVEQEYTSPEHLYAQGGSAGGLLMGAVINEAPELWNGAIAQVPFVDVVSTMLDESIPLTTGEFDEWGNPKDKEYYDYMKSYSPYDNIEKKEYPNLLITTGYWDSQVQYWEPAKWIAKLREYKTDKNLLMMHCDMEVGHGGASGRFERFKLIALEYAFLLHLESIED